MESFGAEGAEASDAFRPDRRIDPEEQMNRPFYENQIVTGFPEPTSKERIARIFQKGHITLRGDPAWGTEDQAQAAERDTFFYTNAAPQLGFFNQGSRLDRPGSKGKLRWRAVETYVLRNAVTMRSRINVFAGPVFDDRKDPYYRFDSKVPMRFWKIAVWAEDDELRSIALIADQAELIKVMPEAAEAAEAFADNLELARVSEFLTTVAQIEQASISARRCAMPMCVQEPGRTCHPLRTSNRTSFSRAEAAGDWRLSDGQVRGGEAGAAGLGISRASRDICLQATVPDLPSDFDCPGSAPVRQN